MIVRSHQILVFFIILLVGCYDDDRSKAGRHESTPVCGGQLSVETYTIIGGGGWGGDRVSEYLTDGKNFRKYLGTVINSEGGIGTVCKGDSVYVYTKKDTGFSHMSMIIDTKIYKLEDLKKGKEFD